MRHNKRLQETISVMQILMYFTSGLTVAVFVLLIYKILGSDDGGKAIIRLWVIMICVSSVILTFFRALGVKGKKEMDAYIIHLEDKVLSLEAQLEQAKEDSTEEIVTSSRWQESTETVCKAVVEVCKSERTDWVKGSDKGGTTDTAGDELFSALVARLHTGKESVHTQAERAAWKAIADAGYTISTGRKPAK